MKTILLMYRCRRIRRQVQSILAARYGVFAAHGAVAARRILRIHKPDVILVDDGGHNRTASALLACLRREQVRTPVVALCRFDFSNHAMIVQRLGASAVVRWPGPVNRLLGAIAKAAGVAA